MISWTLLNRHLFYFTKKFNSLILRFQRFTFLANSSILDLWLDSEYSSAFGAILTFWRHYFWNENYF